VSSSTSCQAWRYQIEARYFHQAELVDRYPVARADPALGGGRRNLQVVVRTVLGHGRLLLLRGGEPVQRDGHRFGVEPRKIRVQEKPIRG
jgi:hypothetical protein